MPFSDPTYSGTGLVRDDIYSTDYAAGVAGWAVTGSTAAAEFEDVTARHSVTASSFRLPSGAEIVPTSMSIGWHNVMDYGAKGDGTTDDAAAFQAAITAAGQGGVVWVPPGRAYALGSTVVLSLGVQIVGGGWHPRYTPRTNMLQTYIRPRPGFVGTTLFRVDPAPVLSPYLDSAAGGGPRLRGLALSGYNLLNASSQPIAAVTATAGVKDLVVEDLTVWQFSGSAFSLATTTGAFRACVATTNGGDGWAWSSMTDVAMHDCYAQGNGGTGFVMPNPNAVTMVQCRSEWNAGYGYQVTGQVSNLLMVGCMTDRSGLDGYLLAHTTGKAPILVGCLAKRDGKGDNVSLGQGYAGFRVAPAGGATGPGVQLDNCYADVGRDDDAAGVRSPDHGIYAGTGANRVTITGGQYQGCSAAITDTTGGVVARTSGVTLSTVDPSTGTVTTSTSDRVAILGNAGAGRELEFWTRTAGRRWVLRTNGTAESGSSAGSDLEFARFNDTGSEIDRPLSISRANGRVTIGGGVLLIPNATNVPGSGPALYVSGGALIFRGGSGTLTTIGPA